MPKGKTETHPQTSEGARLERKALRAYLRRKLAAEKETQIGGSPATAYVRALEEVLTWVMGRQRRYDAKAGGL